MAGTQRAVPVVDASAFPGWTSDREKKVLHDLLATFEKSCHSKGNVAGSILAARWIVLDFLTHARKMPGGTTEEDFEAWGTSLALERKVAPSTQRKYQSCIRRFFAYVTNNARLRNLVRHELGLDLEQVVTDGNSMVHRNPDERGQRESHLAMTPEEQDQLFELIDEEIAFAHQARAKSLLSLRRDKALFFLMLHAGLRSVELQRLNTNSFSPDRRLAHMGRFATLRVLGKGNKYRLIPLDDPELASVMSWYLDKVRPEYLHHAEQHEDALFLSERCKRISYQAIYNRISVYCYRANVRHRSPHSLRHTFASDNAQDGMSLHANQKLLGHTYPATTEGYIQLPETFTLREIKAVQRRRLETVAP